MALEYHTGFDAINSATHLFQMGWTGASPAISTATFRNGTRSLALAGIAWAGRLGLSNAVTRVLGFGYYLASGSPGQRTFATIGDGTPEVAANVHIGLALDNSRHIEVRRGAQLGTTVPVGTVLGVSTNVLATDTWHFIELVVTVNNVAGAVEVYVNGSQVGWHSLTGVDTQTSANAYSNAFGLGGILGITGCFDDVYTLTTTGAAPTARLGDCMSLLKAAGTDAALGAGVYADSTPLSGTDRGAMVDDPTTDDDTTYNSFTAAAQKDAYKTAPLGLTGLVHAVTMHARLRKSDAGAASAQVGLRSGALDDFGADVFPSDASYQWFSRTYTTDPNTGAGWTIPNLDAAQILVKRTL